MEGRGEWDQAMAAADEGRRVAEETGQPIWSTGALVCAARNGALRGDVDEALRMAEAETAASRRNLNKRVPF
jgi:hypothetical protein